MSTSERCVALAALTLACTCSSGTIGGQGPADGGGDADGDGDLDGPLCGSISCPPGTECVDGQCLRTDPCRDVVCPNPGDECSGGVCVSGEDDGDGDGYPARDDCDDADRLVYPGVAIPCFNGCGEGTSMCGTGGEWGDCLFDIDPCELAHAEAECVEGECALVSCASGYGDCDTRIGSGCETTLGTVEDCAGCGDACDSGWTCRRGACVCVPVCDGRACGASDGCGGSCLSGSCPSGEVCNDGECRCSSTCTGKQCGDDDGCGSPCDGDCPENQVCTDEGCDCPGPHYGWYGSSCVPSCGGLLGRLGLPDGGSGCCPAGCSFDAVQGGGPGDTYDCAYCCSASESGGPSCS